LGERENMDNAQRLLDAIVRGASKPSDKPSAGEADFLDQIFKGFGQGRTRHSAADLGRSVFGDAAGGLRDLLRRASDGGRQETPGETDKLTEFADRVKDALGSHPAFTDRALLALTGILLTTRRGRGLVGTLAGLGGLALISGLAWRAYRGQQGAAAPPGLHPANATAADAELFVRTMIAATSADGHVDETERSRVRRAFEQAGIAGRDTEWLERELANPASAAELAALAHSPEKAAQVYAAARLAIEPDAAEEREFLRSLANALKLDPGIKTEIDEGAVSLKSDG
jgi:uncharacterized membrane protein YebE (DUF533 family)